MVPLCVPANHVSQCSERSDVTRRLRQWGRALFFWLTGCLGSMPFDTEGLP